MKYLTEIFRYLPAQATMAGVIPVVAFGFNKLMMRRTAHRQRELREKVVALNVFIGSMNEFVDGSEHHATCLQDALRQRAPLLMRLAAITEQTSGTSRTVRWSRRARRFLLLYAPSGPFAWTLHCIFFFLVISITTGLVRAFLHVAYLRPTILAPILVVDFVLLIVVRIASFHVDRPEGVEEMGAVVIE